MPAPLVPFSRAGGRRIPRAGQDLLLSRTVIDRREVALRGPFRLRLASASRSGRPGAGAARPAQPRTRAGAMTLTVAPHGPAVRPWTARPAGRGSGDVGRDPRGDRGPQAIRARWLQPDPLARLAGPVRGHHGAALADDDLRHVRRQHRGQLDLGTAVERNLVERVGP